MSARSRAMIEWLKDKDPDVWFATTRKLNWDNAVPVLEWIISQPRCDKANAAMIFWFADPGYYAAVAARGEQPSGEAWDLIQAIIRNWNAGLYGRSELAWPDDDGRRLLAAYERSALGEPAIREALPIPSGLFGPFKGRQPRVQAELTPEANAELWDLLDRLGTQAGFRPGSEMWQAQQEGRWKPSAQRQGPKAEGKPGPIARAFGIGLLLLAAAGLLWVLFMRLTR